MILLAILASTSVIDAERAFAKLAQDKGQWTAFRATAAKDAVMFVPRRVNAHTWLKSRKDPQRSVRWQPTKAWMSCDGTLAVTTGNWQREASVGYFTTVWRRQKNGGWKWVLDSGDKLKEARTNVSESNVTQPACRVPAKEDEFIFIGSYSGGGESSDRTLKWDTYISEGGGQRFLNVRAWTGLNFVDVISDTVSQTK